MISYDAYKDSKIEYLGKIPSDWSLKRSKDISDITRGAILRPVDDPSYFDENGHWYYLNISDVTKVDKYLFRGKLKLSTLGSTRSARVKANNLIITASATIGIPFINKVDVCVHDGFIAFKKIKISIEFLYYFLQNKNIYVAIGKSNTQKNIYLDEAKNISIAFPSSLNDQTTIARYLDTKSEAINKKVSLLEKKIYYYQELRNTLINETVTKGLDKNVRLKDSGIDWIGQIPEHWEVKRAKDIFSTMAGGTPSTKNQEYWTGTIPWIPSGKVQNSDVLIESVEDYISDLALVESSTKIAKKDSVLIALTGATCSNIGYLTFDTTINQSIVALLPLRKNQTMSRFYFYFLIASKEKIRTYMTGGAQGGINQEDVRFLEIVSLPYTEQSEIVKFLDTKLNTIDKIIANIQTQIITLKELRKTLINDVVTGKIKVVNDQE